MCGIGKPRSSLLKSLRTSGARRVGRRLPLEATFTAGVTLGITVLIGEREEVWTVPKLPCPITQFIALNADAQLASMLSGGRLHVANWYQDSTSGILLRIWLAQQEIF